MREDLKKGRFTGFSNRLPQVIKFEAPKNLGRIAIILSAPALAFRWWAVRESWFWLDDYRLLKQIALGESGMDWYFAPYGSHFIPITKILSEALTFSSDPYDWALAAIVLTLLNALMFMSAWWMLKTAFGPKPLILVPFVFVTYGSLSFVGTLWWTGAIESLLNMVASFLVLGFSIRYFRSKKSINLLGIFLFTVMGFLATEKMLLTAPVLFVIAVSYFSEGNIFKRSYRAFFTFWPAWRLIILINVASLYFPLPEAGNAMQAKGDLSEIIQTIDFYIGKTLVPMLMGGPWDWVRLGGMHVSPSQMMIGLSWTVFTIIVFISVLLHNRALRAISILGSYALLSAVSLGWMEGGELHPGLLGTEASNLMDVTPFAALTIGLLLVPLVGAREPLEKRQVAYAQTVPRYHKALIMIIFLGGSVYSSVTYAASWNEKMQAGGKSYVNNIIDDLNNGEVEVIPGTVPPSVVPPLMADMVSYSDFLAPLRSNIRVVDFGNNLNLISEEGNILPAPALGQQVSAPGPVAGCGYFVSQQPVIIPIAQSPEFGEWMTFGYLANEDGSLVVKAGTRTVRISVTEGLNNGFVFVRESIDSVTFEAAEGTVLCIDAIRFGIYEPLT